MEEAVNLAQNIIDTSAKASFIITEHGTGKPISGTERSKAERLLVFGRYRPSKQDQNIFVEKSKYRINTPGEKLEIRPKKSRRKNPFGG